MSTSESLPPHPQPPPHRPRMQRCILSISLQKRKDSARKQSKRNADPSSRDFRPGTGNRRQATGLCSIQGITCHVDAVNVMQLGDAFRPSCRWMHGTSWRFTSHVKLSRRGMRKRLPGAIRHHLYSCVDIPGTHNILFAINLAQYPVPRFLTLARASPDPRYRFIRGIHRLRPAQTGTFVLYVPCVVASTGLPLHPQQPTHTPCPNPTLLCPHPI